MADEIRISFSLSVQNGNFRDSYNPGSLSIDQATIGRGGYVQSIGTSEEVVVFGDVVTAGLLVLRNLDEVNYITYGPELTGAMVELGKLNPGDVAFLRLKPAVVMRAKAHTLACKLEVRLYED